MTTTLWQPKGEGSLYAQRIQIVHGKKANKRLAELAPEKDLESGKETIDRAPQKKFDFRERLAIMNVKPDFRINHMGRACLHHNLILFILHEVVVF